MFLPLILALLQAPASPTLLAVFPALPDQDAAAQCQAGTLQADRVSQIDHADGSVEYVIQWGVIGDNGLVQTTPGCIFQEFAWY